MVGVLNPTQMLHGFRIVLTEPSKDIYCMESIHETKFFDNLNLLSMALRGDPRILLVFSILACNTKINNFFAPHSSSKMPETGAALFMFILLHVACSTVSYINHFLFLVNMNFLFMNFLFEFVCSIISIGCITTITTTTITIITTSNFV